MQQVDPKVCSVLRFTNNPSDEDIIIQNCGESYERLKGYSIVLNKSKIPAMKILLTDHFSKYKEFINRSFVERDIEEIRQHCKVYSPDGYVDLFIKEYGGLDSLMLNGPSGIPARHTQEEDTDNKDYENEFTEDDFNESDFVENEEEEDPEMIKRLQDQIKELQGQVETLETELSDKTNECDSARKKVEAFESKYPKEEFKEEYIDIFMDIVEEHPDAYCRDALYQMILNLHNKGDIKEVSRVVADFLNVFEEMDVKENV